MENDLLHFAHVKISEAYKTIGHSHGWSFLYTPGNTLSADTRFLFMGLNPGGELNDYSVSLTTEKGNAYHPDVERDWLGNGQPHPLQMQVVEFYSKLAERLKCDVKELMNSTLAANYCPFRSKTWASLKNKNMSLDVCSSLWTDLFKDTQITTIVCMSSLVYGQMTSIVTNNGGREVVSKAEYVGWGKVKYHYKRFKLEDRDVSIICLPHLSRFKIFSSQGCEPQVNEIMTIVAESFAGNPQ